MDPFLATFVVSCNDGYLPGISAISSNRLNSEHTDPTANLTLDLTDIWRFNALDSVQCF